VTAPSNQVAAAAASLRQLEELRPKLVEFLAQVDQVLGRSDHPSKISRASRSPEDADLISTGAAAKRAGRSLETVRRWCENRGIGRKEAGRWRVSSRLLNDLLRYPEKI
jgi:hypothetical protein